MLFSRKNGIRLEVDFTMKERKKKKKKSGVTNDGENAIEKKLTRQSIYKSTINLMVRDGFCRFVSEEKTLSQTNKGLRSFTMTMSIYKLPSLPKRRDTIQQKLYFTKSLRMYHWHCDEKHFLIKTFRKPSLNKKKRWIQSWKFYLTNITTFCVKWSKIEHLLQRRKKKYKKITYVMRWAAENPTNCQFTAESPAVIYKWANCWTEDFIVVRW